MVGLQFTYVQPLLCVQVRDECFVVAKYVLRFSISNLQENIFERMARSCIVLCIPSVVCKHDRVKACFCIISMVACHAAVQTRSSVEMCNSRFFRFSKLNCWECVSLKSCCVFFINVAAINWRWKFGRILKNSFRTA